MIRIRIGKSVGNALLLGALVAAGYGVGATVAQAQEMPNRGPEIYLGHAHVDGPVDHDDIKVGRYAGRYHSIVLRVAYAPIQFDRVVVHYGNGTSEVLPVRMDIAPGGSSRWIQLPGGERVIRSLELWYARANPGDPVKPEVQLYGRP
jgi:hypothetical protein